MLLDCFPVLPHANRDTNWRRTQHSIHLESQPKLHLLLVRRQRDRRLPALGDVSQDPPGEVLIWLARVILIERHIRNAMLHFRRRSGCKCDAIRIACDSLRIVQRNTRRCHVAKGEVWRLVPVY